MAEETWPTHSAPRITELSFANALIEGPKVFHGAFEIGAIWKQFLANKVDPSFALGQFWAESNFGVSGWNVWAHPPLQSWGNVLYVNSSLKAEPGVFKYEASNGYDYTGYPDWETGVRDYCLLLAQYRDTSPHPKYGDTSVIYGATAKWAAKTPGSDSHLSYLDIVLGRMTRYDIRPKWESELAIYSPGTIYSTNLRYRLDAGDRWYTRPDGPASYVFKAAGSAYFMGQVAGTSWVAIRVNTARLSSDGKTRPVIGYVPHFDAKRLSTVK